MNSEQANALLWEIKDAVTALRRRNARPHVIMIDASLHKKFELGLDCGPVLSVSKVPLCVVENFRPGWLVQRFTGGVQ